MILVGLVKLVLSNMVRLDGLLTNNNNKVIENKDKTIKITRK